MASVLDDLFSYGTTSLDRVQFQKALDDIAADESAGTSFSLHVLSSHFDDGMRLLAANLLEPALPQTAFDTVREQTAFDDCRRAGEFRVPVAAGAEGRSPSQGRPVAQACDAGHRSRAVAGCA